MAGDPPRREKNEKKGTQTQALVIDEERKKIFFNPGSREDTCVPHGSTRLLVSLVWGGHS